MDSPSIPKVLQVDDSWQVERPISATNWETAQTNDFYCEQMASSLFMPGICPLMRLKWYPCLTSINRQSQSNTECSTSNSLSAHFIFVALSGLLWTPKSTKIIQHITWELLLVIQGYPCTCYRLRLPNSFGTRYYISKSEITTIVSTIWLAGAQIHGQSLSTEKDKFQQPTFFIDFWWVYKPNRGSSCLKKSQYARFPYFRWI